MGCVSFIWGLWLSTNRGSDLFKFFNTNLKRSNPLMPIRCEVANNRISLFRHLNSKQKETTPMYSATKQYENIDLYATKSKFSREKI